MTIEQAAIENRLGKVTEYIDTCLQEKVQRDLDMFKAGAKWVMEQTIYFLETNSRFPNDMIERYKKFMEK